MAARPQRRGGGPATPRRTAQPVYEDFKPPLQWHEDNENHILTIDLPGFVKEQVRVSTEDTDIIRVHGERAVYRNRRTRFHEDIQVPANSDMNRVRAKFVGGSLIITIAKKSLHEPQEPEEASGAEIPKQPITQLGQDELQHPPEAKASPPRDEKSSESTVTDPRMKQDQPHEADVPRDGRRGTPFRDIGRVIPRDYEISEHANAMEKTSKRSEELPEAGAAKKAKLKNGETSAMKENKKESEGKHEVDQTDRADIRVSAVKGVTEVNEERQLVVNMGVAMLVIMALSAYVTYQFASGKDQN